MKGKQIPADTDFSKYWLRLPNGADAQVIYEENLGKDESGTIMRLMALKMSKEDQIICNITDNEYLKEGFVWFKVPERYLWWNSESPTKPVKSCWCDYHKIDAPYTYIGFDCIDKDCKLGETLYGYMKKDEVKDKMMATLEGEGDKLKEELRKSAEGWFDWEKMADRIADKILIGISGLFAKRGEDK